ncbi:MAG TPA: heat-inducible transcriptional repressor HrcA [Patescibacteria group bacterium]|jgi:heat-inducible transcriptional repressor|nr:heat-inducible transcriptional repressor HrcA [Patescibacteria group bacterium]
MKDIELEKRGQEILEAIVKAFIETGEPVGSRTVSRLNREGLSAATIRNVMAELEERDLLAQPHASAGRVPTDLGYRVYVDSLLKGRRLPPAEERLIESSLQGNQTEINELFTNVSRLLSRLSKHMGVVVSPHIARVRLRDVEFVRLAPHRVLVILVAASGTIHNKVVEIESDHEQEKLDQIGRLLTDEFKGHTLPEIRDRILEMMGQEKALYDSVLRDALTLGKAGLEYNPAIEAAGSDVFMDGTSNLLSDPVFASFERLRGLFRTFEEKHELLRVLNSCLEQNAQGVRVIIGSENPNPELTDCALVASGYGTKGQTLGTLGIIGPTRMEYARAIALVDSVARLFSDALSRYQG